MRHLPSVGSSTLSLYSFALLFFVSVCGWISEEKRRGPLCCLAKRRIPNDSVVPRELEQEIQEGAAPGSFHQVYFSTKTRVFDRY